MKSSFGWVVLLVVLGGISSLYADVYEWEYVDPADPSAGRVESTTLTPDGAGIIAGPGAVIYELDLTQAYLIGSNGYHRQLAEWGACPWLNAHRC